MELCRPELEIELEKAIAHGKLVEDRNRRVEGVVDGVMLDMLQNAINVRGL
jgi:hypothetical protein